MTDDTKEKLIDYAIAQITNQVDSEGVGAVRLKDSSVIGISVSMLRKLLRQAESADQNKVIILIKNGPTVGVA